MAITCPNKSLKEWKSLVESVGENKAYGLWNAYEGNVPEQYYNINKSSQIKEGVDFVFEQNPELASIGTPQQYSQYLNTIFPDSKVKDIVYHGSNEKIEQFKKPTSELSLGKPAIYFRKDYNKHIKDSKVSNSAIVNSEFPFIAEDFLDYQERKSKRVFFDSVYINNEDEFAVFEPEQIHILGSKEDIEGFKEFVNKQSSFKRMQIPDTNSRNLEVKLGIRNADGSAVVFSNSASRAIVKERIKQSLPEGYDVKESKVIVRKTQKEGLILNIVRTNKSSIKDDSYGEFDVYEANKIKNKLFKSEGELNSQQLMSNLKESGLVSNTLLELLSDIDVPVIFVELEGNVLMDTDGSVIRINKNLLENTHPQQVANSIMHELVHIKTVNAIENPQNEAEKFLSQRIKYIFNEFKKRDSQNRYGGVSESEFVAELLARKDFRDYVKTLENGTIWKKFINFILDFLGIKRGSEKLVSQLEKYIGTNTSKSTKFVNKNMEILNKSSELLAKMIDTVGTRIKATEATLNKFKNKEHQKELIEKQTTLLNELVKKGNDKKYLQGVVQYLQTISQLKEEFNTSVNTIRENLSKKGYSAVFGQGSSIRSLGNFIFGNQAILEDLNNQIKQIKAENPDLKDIIEELDNLRKDLTVSLTELQNEYSDLSAIIFSKFLLPFGMGRSLEHIQQVLKSPVKDIGFISRWLSNMQESGDEALALIDAVVKHYHIQAANESRDFEVDILKAKKKLEDAGIKDVNFLIKRDSSGKNTHYFITERDILDYKKKQEEFSKTLPDPEKTSNPEDTKKNNKREWGKFFSKHGISEQHSFEEYNELLTQKKAELGENFDAWLEANSIFNPTTGNRVIPRKLDSNYTNMMKDSNKSEFYWKILNQKYHNEKYLPASKKHLRRLPQIRKDFVERVKNGNWNRIYENVKEDFKITEDDINYGTKYGLTDERGNVIQFLPIYFVEKIPNPEDISQDITSSMVAYNYHYTKREKISMIVDLLEIGKDVIKDRKVLKTSKGKVIEAIKTFTGEKRTEQLTVKDSELVKRFQTYLNMFIYGEMKKEGLELLGINVEKALDNLGKYTWLRTLAGNMYATIANVSNGEVVAALESINKKYFSGNSLLFAEKELEGGLPGVMQDIGTRVPKNKLTIWTDEMDSMNNMEEKVFGTNAEMKTKLGKLVTGSGVGFLSKLVEFRLHNKISLAVADTYRYDSNKKEFVFKRDFFKELTDLKDKKANEIKKLRAEEREVYAKLTKENKVAEANQSRKDYNEKINNLIKQDNTSDIKVLEKSLNKQWNNMTNFYSAHEARDGRLELKSEFKINNYNETKTKFIMAQHGINNTLQGMYAKLDTSAFQQKAVGRLAVMYRKWMLPAFNRRFAKKHTDFEKQMDEEGYYRAFGNFINEIFKDLKQHQFSLSKNWNSLTSEEKLGAMRVFADMAFLLAVSVLIWGLKDLDDDDNWSANLLFYQTNRLFTEYGAMTPPFMFKEGFNILKSPAAAVDVFQEFYNLLTMNPFKWNEEIEKGKYKGMTRLEKGLVRTIPMWDTLYGTMFPEEKVKFYNLN